VLACFIASAKVAECVIRKENTRQEEVLLVTKTPPGETGGVSQMANHWPPEITALIAHAQKKACRKGG
jgi:hypothetical protein